MYPAQKPKDWDDPSIASTRAVADDLVFVRVSPYGGKMPKPPIFYMATEYSPVLMDEIMAGRPPHDGLVAGVGRARKSGYGTALRAAGGHGLPSSSFLLPSSHGENGRRRRLRADSSSACAGLRDAWLFRMHSAGDGAAEAKLRPLEVAGFGQRAKKRHIARGRHCAELEIF